MCKDHDKRDNYGDARTMTIFKAVSIARTTQLLSLYTAVVHCIPHTIIIILWVNEGRWNVEKLTTISQFKPSNLEKIP